MKNNIVGGFLVLFVFAFSNCGGADTKTEIISIAGPVSLTGAYLETSAKTINGAKAAILWLEQNGGFKVGDANGVIELSYEDDESDADKVTEITESLCQDASIDFIMAPYSSGLTTAAAAVTEATGKLLLISGGASNAIYSAGSDNIVASIGPASAYHKGILDGVYLAEGGTANGLSVAFVYEDASFAMSVQAAAKAYAQELGFTVAYENNYPKGADETSTELQNMVIALAAANPDLVLGGGHSVDGRALTYLMGEQNIAPRAFSLLVAPVSSDFYQLVEPCADPCDYANHPAEGVSGPSHWEMGVSFSAEAAAAEGKTWFGPSQQEFIDLYKSVAGEDQEPTYHAANGAVMILSLVLALEAAGSKDTAAVRQAFDGVTFMSFWGDWDVDETGANTGHKMVEVQWQQGEKQLVWPEEGKTADFLYPIN